MSKRPADDEPAADDAKQARLTIGVPAPPPSRIGGADGRKNYELGEVLGEGAFAIVHRAMCLENSTEYAVKLIDKDGTDLAEAKRERSILERVGMHKHVAGLFDSFVQPSAWVLVLELAEGGEVFERICDGGPFSEADAAAVVRQVALALQHIHGLGVVHRDLKPENLLLVSQATRKELGLLWRKDAHVKVADFGLASLVGEPPEGERGAVAGTVTYMAPELFGPKGEGTGTRPVGPGLDVWSVGVILFNLLSGYQPFDPKGDAPEHELQRRIACGDWRFDDFPERWQHVSDAACSLVRAMLHPSAEARLSCAQLLASPWVMGAEGSEGAASAAPLPGSDEALREFNEVCRTWRAAVHAAALVLQLPGVAVAAPASSASGSADSASAKPEGAALPAAAVEELRALFASLDTDGSGSLELGELRRLVLMLGAQEQAAARLLRSIDTDGDGKVGFSEFCNAVAPMYLSSSEKLRAAFDLFDTDQSGGIDRAEMAAMLSKLGLGGASRPELAAKLFDEADTNHDEKISFEEFLRYVNKAAARQGSKGLSAPGAGS